MVLAEKVKVPSRLADMGSKGREANQATAGFLRRHIPVIEATLVAEQVFGAPLMTLADFPCLTPPWPAFWLEYVRPRNATKATPERWGLLCVEEGIEHFAKQAADQRWPVSAERAFTMGLYAEYRSQVFGPCAQWEIAVDERGIGVQADYAVMDRNVRDEENTPDFERLMWTALQTITFFHCRNVHVVPGEPLPPKVAKAQTKKLGRAPLVYSVVKIDPFGQRKARAAANGGGTAAPRRLHTVPGHFAHFGNCCPGVHEPHGLAFGKLTGMFWSPPHIRGDLEAGAVVHDYQMRPSGTAPARP